MTPQQLLDQISTLSEDYYRACEEAGAIAERKGVAWLDMRSWCATNAECDQQWAATADGKRENYLKWYTKGLQAKRSALILQLRSDQGTL